MFIGGGEFSPPLRALRVNPPETLTPGFLE